MATRRDPSATGLLVRAFTREIKAKLARLRGEVWQVLVTDDVLSLDSTHLMINARIEKRAWRFRTSPQKVEAFDRWIQEIIDEGLLSTDAKGVPWVAKYTDQAYQKGLLRAFTDAHKKESFKPLEFLMGSKDQFIKGILAKPENISKMRLLATRAFEDLKGISGQVATQLNKILAGGLLRGDGPREIASQMTKQIQGLSRRRALAIARTEMVGAHAEGQLDSFEAQGIRKVGLYAEWATAKDDRVCRACGALEGVQFTIEEARGLIPRHIGCRCTWIPGEESARLHRKRTMRRKVRDSIIAERGKIKKKTKREKLLLARKSSTWLGKKLVRNQVQKLKRQM